MGVFGQLAPKLPGVEITSPASSASRWPGRYYEEFEEPPQKRMRGSARSAWAVTGGHHGAIPAWSPFSSPPPCPPMPSLPSPPLEDPVDYSSGSPFERGTSVFRQVQGATSSEAVPAANGRRKRKQREVP